MEPTQNSKNGVLTANDSTLEKPVIGLVATEDNGDSLLRCMVRARDKDYPLIVTHNDNGECEALRLAAMIGANIIDPIVANPSLDDHKSLFHSVAQSKGAPGVIVHEPTINRIDFDLSEEVLNREGYCVDGILQDDDLELNSETLAAIPAYNEESSIGDVVKNASEYVDSVLVVDDGSKDETAEIARSAGAEVVEHKENSGYGASLKTIFKESYKKNTDLLVILDGDGQHDEEDISNIIGEQEGTDADIVIGSRFVEGSETDFPKYRLFGLTIVNLLTNFSMGSFKKDERISDTQSGFRLYNANAIESLAKDSTIGDHMDASTDILHHAHEKGYKIEEVGTTIDYDVEDASSHNPVSHGFILVANILRTVEQEHPITILGIPGFICSFVGLGFGYWTLLNYVSSGLFPIGLAVISGFFLLAGILACFTAIILHSLNTHIETQV
ncbi:glycosyltransferase family 2 protein [Haloarchaeobius sp. DYHT-AS-18]|uniref:glycosyltransferase family 2 protein n=1 Tax=Haloarchaeobius sp. DYHT-AS-18 TaxID=3446117 RepID=UPI003EC058ED